ncbi:uncharacterized protein LOC128550389 [Mercenaria mercenaria]|uniref:uncharacterized protein LOC128550389 n=1 Tax=Mercenaria mercenaria TaxID=6596 RepID=UPI00234F5835|nr:uncharacterized protein LOC128550389 [Mercenaria mercenaria]
MTVSENGQGMLCSVCVKHQRRPKKCVPGKAVWVDIPCTSIRQSSLVFHKDSDSHKKALVFDVAEAKTGGGIEACFMREEHVNREAMTASMTLLYFPCKEEIPHTTKHKPLVDVAKTLGVDVLNSLEKGDNAKYTKLISLRCHSANKFHMCSAKIVLFYVK